jgi:hypothetical protein
MPDGLRCVVCGEPVDEKTSSICDNCGERFHLNPRSDVSGKDCGAVWINEQHLGLEFACQRCLDGRAPVPPAPQPRVLRPRTRQRRYRKLR